MQHFTYNLDFYGRLLKCVDKEQDTLLNINDHTNKKISVIATAF